jgi:hypothetical protein
VFWLAVDLHLERTDCEIEMMPVAGAAGISRSNRWGKIAARCIVAENYRIMTSFSIR